MRYADVSGIREMALGLRQRPTVLESLHLLESPPPSQETRIGKEKKSGKGAYSTTQACLYLQIQGYTRTKSLWPFY